MLGNAIVGVTRPVPLDSKSFSQQLRWDESLASIMDMLQWTVAPLDSETPRKALHAPTNLADDAALLQTHIRMYMELAGWCAHLGGTPPSPDEAETHGTLHVSAAVWPGFVPTIHVPAPGTALARSYARLGVAMEASEADVVAMYRLQMLCFPALRASLFLELEHIQSVRAWREQVPTLLAVEQSQGLCTRQDLHASWTALQMKVPGTTYDERAPLWDEDTTPILPCTTEAIVQAYNQRIHEIVTSHGSDDDWAKTVRAMEVLARFYAPVPALDERLRTSPIHDVQDAYQLLQVSADIDDALVWVGYEVYASESTTRQTVLRSALEKIADVRASSFLQRRLRGENDDDVALTATWPRGLDNIGNTCYLNSLLQYLYWIEPVRMAVEHVAGQAHEVPTTLPTLSEHQVTADEWERAHLFVDKLGELFSAMTTTKEASLRPDKELAYLALVPLAWEKAHEDDRVARDVLMQHVSAQQDVCECLDNMMFLLQVALHGTQASAAVSIADLFTGMSTQVLHTQDETPAPPAKDESFMSIPVTLLSESRDLYDALDTFFSEEWVTATQGPTVQRTITLKKAPPILQIHIQRVQYDRQSHRAVKNQAALPLPDTLYLDRYMDVTTCPDRVDALRGMHTQAHTWRAEMTTLRERMETLLGERLAAVEHMADAVAAWQAQTPREEATDWASLVHARSPDTFRTEAQSMRAEAETLRMQWQALHERVQALWANEHQVPYRLASVFMHRGEATHGHYFVNQREFSDNTWYSLNDTRVTTVPQEESTKEYVCPLTNAAQPHRCHLVFGGVRTRYHPFVRQSKTGRHSYLATTITRFASNIEGQVFVPNHVLNLATHSNDKERNEVQDQNGPEHGNIKYTEHGGAERQEDGLCRTKPELEFGQPTDKGAEFLLVLTLGRVEHVAHQA